MTSLFLDLVVLVTAALAISGTWLGYKVARITGRAPLGWTLIYIGFGLVGVRLLIRLYQVVVSPSQLGFLSSDFVDYFNLGSTVFVVFGFYLLYKDFKSRLREREAEMVAPRIEASDSDR